MTNDSDEITLMIPASSSQPDKYPDRGGGKQQGLKELIQKLASENPIKSELFKNNLETTMSQVDKVLKSVSKTLTSEWKVESIAVGLCVNAEGSIGIATAGVETSIEITFSPK